MAELDDRIRSDIEQYERETGHPYRTAYKTRGRELSCVVTPLDLGLNNEEISEKI